MVRGEREILIPIITQAIRPYSCVNYHVMMVTFEFTDIWPGRLDRDTIDDLTDLITNYHI